MKQETGKKSKKWLWIVLAIVAVLAAVAVALVFFLQPAGPVEQPEEEKPTSAVYWNIDKVKFTQDEETGLSTREKGDDGLIHFRFASQGQLLELATSDRRLVNYIDTMDACGLIFDADGLIIDALPVSEIAVETAKSFYVKKVSGDTVVVNSSIALNGMDITFQLTDGVHVMDVRQETETPGQSVTLEVMDTVSVYGSEETPATSVFLMERSPASEPYLRIDRMYNSATGATSRVPDKDGIYTIPFALNGEILQLKCKDVAVVTEIDFGSGAASVMGLVFDEEGYIIDTVVAATAMRGKLLCTSYSITAMNGNSIEATYLASGNEQGKVVNFTIDENTVIIMNETGCGHFIGEKMPDLQMHDRLIVWTDAENKAMYMTVESRLAPEGTKMYYNFRKQYNSTTQETKRVPDEKGYYVFELAAGGKVVTVKTKDKEIANKMDGVTYGFFGLKVQGGIVKEYYDHRCVSGGNRDIVGNRFVTQIVNPILQIAGVADFAVYNNFMISPTVEVYDCTGYPGTKMGAKTELKVGDRVVGTANISGEVTHMFVLDRYQKGAKVYYRSDTKYDTTTLETTRVPDADGYYVYEMYENGKIHTFKTKSKELADYIDVSAPHIALKVSNGIIKNAYSSIAAQMYSLTCFSTNIVESVSADKMVKCYYVINGVRTDAPKELKIGKNCQILNVSGNFNEYRGEKTTLKPGDKIVALKDYQTEELTHVWITSRAMQSPPYFHVQRQYADGQTTRVPDENGYYWIEVFADGKIHTFKTKDKDLMSRIDAYGQESFFALRTNGNVVEAVDAVTGSKYATSAICSQFDVMKISGKKITAEKMRPGSANLGTVAEFTYDSNTKIYDVCPYSPNRFKPAKLDKGDRINVYTDADGKITYIFILYTCERKNGPISKCSHCNETVWWEPWYGSRIDSEQVVHFYVPTDFVRGQGTVSRDKNNYPDTLRNTVIYDMNGRTLGSTGRSFLVYGDMIIIDSVGGGVLEAQGANDTAIGGNFLVMGGSVSIYDGVTIRRAANPNGVGAANGGNFYINNLAIKNEKEEVIETRHGKVNIYDAVIEAWPGVATDHFYLAPDAELNIYGGVIKGGTVQVSGAGKVNWTGGKMESDVSVTGTTLTMPAKPNMTGMMLLSNGGKLDISKMSSDVTIKTMPAGVFTTERDDIDKYLNVFKPAVDSVTIVKEGKALAAQMNMPAMTDDLEFVPGTSLAVCPVCKGFVNWTPITQAVNGEKAVGTPANGMHYYLTEDITYTGGETFISAPSRAGENMYSACVHLNGHNLTNTKEKVFGGSNGQLNVMGSGTVSGNGSLGATAYINTNYEFENNGIFLYSGTYTKPASNDQAVVHVHANGGRIYLGPDAKVVTEKGSLAALLRGGAWINGNLIVSGTIEGGYLQTLTASTREDGAPTSVALVIDGGNIQGGVKVDSSTIVALGGAAKVGGSGLDLTSGALIAASQLTEGAEVVVRANGTFSAKLANAAEQVKYYKNNAAYLPVEVKEGALWTDKDPNAPDFVPEPAIPAKPEILKVDNSDLVLDANKQAKCPVCNEVVTWVAITEVKQPLVLEGDTHYYLANDITYEGEEDSATGDGAALSYKTLSRIESCLHLNGHNITATKARAIYAGGYLNVMGNGTVSGNGTLANRGATVETNHNSARLNLYGGTYVKSGLDTVNPIVNVFGAGGVINLYEGAAVDGSKVTKSGTVRAFAGTFNMYGGNVIGGNGNAVEGRNWSKTTSGTVNIFGGKIQGGTNAFYSGGTTTAFGGFGIYGGEIDGNATFTAQTNAVIAGNPVVANLVVPEGAQFVLGEVTEGAAITVGSATGAFTAQCENVDKYAKYFTAAPGMIVSVKDYALYGEKDPTYVPDLEQPENINDNLIFKAGTNNAYCSVCEVEVEWIPVTQEANGATALGVMAGGVHYYLAEDVTYSGTANFVTGPGGNKVGCFHLNGHNLTTTQGAAFFGYPGVMNVMGNGIVTGGKNAELQGAAVGINTNDAGGTINLYGGTYTKAETANLSSVIYVGANGGKINIFKDVKVIGLEGKPAIDLVGANLVDTVLTIDGAVIEGELKAAPLTARVKKSVQVNLNGVTVDTVTLNANAKLNLAGDTVIKKLDMASGAKFTVGALGENASIDVAGNGVISEASDNVNTYFGKFKSSYGYKLSVVDNALVSELATTPDQPGQEPSDPSETPTEPSETPTEPSEPSDPSEPSEPQEPTVPAYTDDLQFEEGTKKAVCAVCKQLVEWTPVTQETHGSTAVGVLAAGSHYYLAEDITFTGTGNFVTGPGAGNVGCFHLNGHNVTATQAAVFFGYPGVMNVMGTGTVTGGKNAELQGATVGINTNGADGAINLYSGTYTKAETSDLSSVMYIGANGGKINIYKDAKVVGLAGKPAIDLIGASLVDAVLTVDGAVIEGDLKIMPLAGRVKKTVQVNLNGVTVNTVSLNENAKLDLAGDTVIKKLDMASGAKFTVGVLGENASIDVAGEGTLTEPSENVSTYFAKFKSSYGYSLSVVENALVSAVATTPDQPGENPTDPSETTTAPTEPSETPTEPSEPEEPAGTTTYTEDLKFKTGTQKAMCAVCGEEVEWIPVTQAEHGAAGIGRIADGGLHYYLTEDINYSGTAEFVLAPNGGQTGCLHLNGHNITSVQSRVVSGYAGVINILGKGTVTGGANTAEHAATVGINTGGANGVINLYSGTYTKAASCVNASVVYISANGGKINIHKDAKVIGMAGAPAVNILGAGLVDAVLTIDGATIEGDLQFVPLTVRVKKNVQINLKDVTVGNVTLNENAKISLAGKTVAGKLELAAGALVTASALTEGAQITVNATGTFSAALDNAADQAKYYKHVDATYVVQAKDGVLCVEKDPTYVPGLEAPENVNAELTFAEGSNTAYCPVCKADVAWTAITQESNGASSLGVMQNGVHYYLAEDITYSGADAFVTGPGGNKTGCFHLNGHNITATKNRVFFGYPGVMNVMGNGTVTGGQNAELQGATIGINTNDAGGTINLYGGTYTKPETCDKSAVIYIGANGGKINIYKDVKVIGLEGKPAIDIVGASLVDTVMTIDGAVIVGEIKAAPLAGRVKKTVQVTLKDATVDTVTLNNTTKLILAGDTVIQKLAMSTGAKITVAALGSNASIDISGEGVLSEVTSHVTTCFDKFKSTYGYVLSIVDGALVSTAAAQGE